MALPFDVLVIGESYATFNWCPGATRSPCSFSVSTGGLAIPLIPIQACPSGSTFAFSGGVWSVGDGAGAQVPNRREGWTPRGLLADNFNNETSLSLSDSNFHFFGHSASTANFSSDTTGLWNDTTDTHTWLQLETLGSNAGSGKTALDILRSPPTGRLNVWLSLTGNDWLKAHEQAIGQKIMGDQTTLNSNISTGIRQVLDIIYANNPLAFVDWFGYVNLPLGEKDGTQYDGNAFKIGYPEDTFHKGLSATSHYPNPPGTQFCPQLQSPFLTPSNIASIPNLPTSINSTNFPRSIHTATFATDFNQRNNNDLQPWYGHWWADQNTANLASNATWNNNEGFGAGIAVLQSTNTFGNAFVTQDISNDQVNAQWQASLNPIMSQCETDYSALGFNLNTYPMWTSMNDIGTQLGTDKPATQSMNKFGFADGFLHLSANTAPIFVQRQLALWRQTSPLAATLHGMKLSAFTIGVVSVNVYEGVPGNIGQDRIYVDICNTGNTGLYVGDSTVTVPGGSNPGIPIPVGGVYKLIVYGGDDIWIVATAIGGTCSILRTGRA